MNIPFYSSIQWEIGNSVSSKLKELIFQALEEVNRDFVEKLKITEIGLEHPNSENYGDYSTNLAMKLAGRLKMKPTELAEKIKEKLDQYIIKHQSTPSKADSKITSGGIEGLENILEKVEVQPPGFINLWLRKTCLITLINQLLKFKESVGTSQIYNESLTGKKIMVEFAHPNTHKEFHIGHLRNISIGESIVRTLEANGAELFRANYEGDVGLHVAKAIWGVKLKIKNEKSRPRADQPRAENIKNLRKLSPPEKAKFLGEAYALGSKAYEEDEKAKKEIIDLNKAIYTDPQKVELWEETRGWSLEYFNTVYKRVGTHFDRLFFESEVEKLGREMVIEAVNRDIFIKDNDGSIYFPGEKYGLNNCVFVTRENYATYEGKEIALEELEFETFPYDLSINNVASEQSNFFQIGYKATEVLFPRHKDKHFHLAYGMVQLKSGKMSSRTGQVITADWLIDEAKSKIYQIIEKSNKTSQDITKADIDEIAEKTAVAAVKYSMLRVNPLMEIAFDLAASISLDGDSGPYLLYTYARCKSVMRKSQGSGVRGQGSDLLKPENYNLKPNTEELSLLRTLYRFPEVVIEAGRTLSPNLLCSFLFDLAQKYNLFYNKHSILSPPSNFRLFLTHATSQIIKKGLYLLGIGTVERM